MNQDHTKPPPSRFVAKTHATFALLGPLIGGLLALLMMILFSGKITTMADAGSMSFVTLIFGYVFGLVPATLTGLAVAWSMKAQRHRSPMWLGALWGTIFGGATGWLIASLGDGSYAFFTVALLALIGAIAGLICGWLVRAR
jgi:uncharacterized BrkB/YihY/UPF0761 family membrane protein